MSLVSHYKTRMRKSFRTGLITAGITVWFIPGIFFQLIEFAPKNTDGFINKLFHFSYQIAPDVSSLQEVFVMVRDGQLSSWWTTGNILGSIIALTFLFGCGSLSGAYRLHSKLHALKAQANEELMKEEFKA